jgi:hypothetical protein
MLSVAELEYITRAKKEFNSRRYWSYEISSAIGTEEVRALLHMSKKLNAVSNLASLDRLREILLSYADSVCREGGRESIARWVLPCKAIDEATRSKEFHSLHDRWRELKRQTFAEAVISSATGKSEHLDLFSGLPKSEYSEYRWYLPLSLFRSDEKVVAVAQALFRDQWLPGHKARGLLKKIDTICKSDVINGIRAQL